jgi:hypothetical protein
MPLLQNSKFTNNRILYNRGVPDTQKNFVLLASLNYSALRLLQVHNRRSGRPVYSLF